MNWIIDFHSSFKDDFTQFSENVQDALLIELEMLEKFGSFLGRPTVDTLKNSKHSNMKELRFNADNGVWRCAFAFDPDRQAILLIAGDKSGVSSSRFYKQLIKKADRRFDQHLQKLKEKKS